MDFRKSGTRVWKVDDNRNTARFQLRINVSDFQISLSHPSVRNMTDALCLSRKRQIAMAPPEEFSLLALLRLRSLYSQRE
jgi:hypothetical protein